MAGRRNGKLSMDKTFLIFLSIALIVSLAANAYYIYLYYQIQAPAPVTFFPPLVTGNLSNVSELSTDSFVKITNVTVQEATDHSDIILANGCTGLVGSVDIMQGQSITNALDKVINARPNTHDLMKDTFDVFDINVLMVKVVGIKSSNYIGKLIVQQGDRIASLDSRPSDGIAIALRVDAPIYMNSTLLSEKGENIC